MRRSFLKLLAGAVLVVAAPVRGMAEDKTPEPAALKADMDLITGAIGPAATSDDPGEYCVNIADQAADARAAWQAGKIAELEKEISQRITELESKRAEYQSWMKQREEILAQADAHLVEIYAKMKPDAASQQMAALEDEMAAAILAKLNARVASAILNEMDATRAAQLTKAMADAARGIKQEKKS